MRWLVGKLAPGDLVERGDLVSTSPLRTTLDLLRLLERPDALAAADAMLHAGLLTKGELVDGLGRFAGYRGIAQARELADLTEPATESPMESRTRLRAVDAGFPRPEVQVNVYDGQGLLIGRLDMGYLEWCKGIEFDGDEHHSSQPDRAHDESTRPLRGSRLGHPRRHPRARAGSQPRLRVRGRGAARHRSPNQASALVTHLRAGTA